MSVLTIVSETALTEIPHPPPSPRLVLPTSLGLLAFVCKKANICTVFYLFIWSDKTVVWEIGLCWRQLFVVRFVSVWQSVQSVQQPLVFRLRCVRCRTDGTCGASRDWQVELKLFVTPWLMRDGLSVTLVIGGVLFWRWGLVNSVTSRNVSTVITLPTFLYYTFIFSPVRTAQ